MVVIVQLFYPDEAFKTFGSHHGTPPNKEPLQPGTRGSRVAPTVATTREQ